MAVETNPRIWGTTSVVTGEGDYNAVAMLPDGGYVVAWRDNGQITFQIYSGNGDKVGGTRVVDAQLSANASQWQPDILTNADGSFVISWTEGTGVASGGQILRSQTFDMHGGKTAAAVQLSDTLNYSAVHAATNGNGGRVTGYVKKVGDNTKLAVIETAGTTSTETVIDSVRIGTTNQTVASGEVDLDWLGNDLLGNNLGYAVGIPINGNGLAIGILKNGTVTTFETLIANTKDYDVVALKNPNGTPNGRFVVTYTDQTNYQVKVDTFRWNSNTNKIERESSVDVGPRTSDSGGQFPVKTSITALRDGGYAVAYKGQGAATASDIFVKVFDASGAQGPAIQIPLNGQQNTPAISEMADGRLAVTWANPGLGTGAIETVIVDARAAAVTVVGTGQNDIYAPSKHAEDNLNGGAGFDTLTFKESTAGVSVSLVEGKGYAGDAFNDTYTSFEKVIGTNFNDTLAGGNGHVLVGGAGNDTYTVTASNTVIDEAGGGYDQVYSSATYTLSAGIENLFATGSDAINLTGNESNNLIVGNEAGNQLVGAGGNDTLQGSGGNDVLTGGNGDDVLTGGLGADVMDGGAGNDSYVIDNANDVVNDTGGGIDSVTVSVSYDLKKLGGIENINGSGSGSITLRGTAGNNAIGGGEGADILYGDAGNDVLNGYGGNDRIHGGLGNDILTGGTGKDIFVFDTAPNKRTNVDKITDYNVSLDSIYLDNKYFKVTPGGSLSNPKKMASKHFYKGAKAHDKDDRIIYDQKKGILYYDKDGIGSSAAVKIATLDKNLNMKYSEFFVI